MKLVLSENMSQVNVVGKSKEKLFDMWRNYEFLNIHATYS